MLNHRIDTCLRVDNLLLPVVPALLEVQILKIVRPVVTSVQHFDDSFSLKACDEHVKNQKHKQFLKDEMFLASPAR